MKIYFQTLLISVLFSLSAGNAIAVDAHGNLKATYRYGPERSGYTDVKTDLPLELKWFVNTREKEDYIFSPKVSSALIGEGSVLYLATLENSFVAYDTAKREFIWRFDTAGRVGASATLSGDRIYFGDTQGYIYCLDKVSGKVMWQQGFKHEILSSPLVVDDKLFFTDMNDSLYALDIDSGKITWKSEQENYFSKIVIRDPSSPSYNNGYIYQGFSDGYLYCFDEKEKTEVFRKKIKDKGLFYDVDSPAAVDGEVVYASSYDDSFMAVYADRAQTKWEIKVKGNGYPSFNSDSLVISSSDGYLYKVDKEFGNIIWERELSNNLTAPIITDDYVFVASEDYFYVIDVKTGDVKYEYEPGSGINSELCLIGEYLYFTSNKGYLYCFKSKSPSAY